MDKRTYPDKASKNTKTLNKKELATKQKSIDTQEVAQSADLTQKIKKQEKSVQKAQRDSVLQKDSALQKDSQILKESSATKEAKNPTMQKNAKLPQSKETSLAQDSKKPLQEPKSAQEVAQSADLTQKIKKQEKSVQKAQRDSVLQKDSALQKDSQILKESSATKESARDSKNTKTQSTQNKNPKKAQENANVAQALSANATQVLPQKSAQIDANNVQAPNEETEPMQTDSQISQKEALLANMLESSQNKAQLANKELTKPKEQTPKPHKAQNDESKESHKISEVKMQDSKQGGNPKQGSQQQNAQSVQGVQNEFEQVQDSPNKEFLESLLELHTPEEGKNTKPSVREKAAMKESSEQKAQNAQNIQPTRTHTITPFAYRTALARESVRNFASNLHQEIQNYKPPLTKITLELHPQNLGTLEVSISKKGKDLHVQVHSNQQAIALFMQNQTELRTNLAQIGFENVDLSFSQNGGENAKQGQNQHNQDSNLARNENSLENDDTSANMPNMMYLRIPRYA
ncbi:flagellar hook-length control protein FliK [Helicobacter himalayensis]|uniref:flagellar hook-length control protein FliK n=1 Tax=Helicobacter himalayensis TaxID=1591088 RepID=UPI003D6F2EB8